MWLELAPNEVAGSDLDLDERFRLVGIDYFYIPAVVGAVIGSDLRPVDQYALNEAFRRKVIFVAHALGKRLTNIVRAQNAVSR